jgi:hypothetical protein
METKLPRLDFLIMGIFLRRAPPGSATGTGLYFTAS